MSMSEDFKFYEEYKAARRARREPGRIAYDTERLEDLGYEVSVGEDGTVLYFTHRGSTVRLWPYTGWFSGQTVNDGRGVDTLLRQLRRSRALQAHG